MKKLIDADVVTDEMRSARNKLAGRLFDIDTTEDDRDLIFRTMAGAAPAASPWVRITKDTLPPDESLCALANNGDNVSRKIYTHHDGVFYDCNGEPCIFWFSHYMLIKPPQGDL